MAFRVALHLELGRPVRRPLDLLKHFQLLLTEVGRGPRVDHPVEDVDQSVVLNVVLLEHGPLHEVHVADGDGRKVLSPNSITLFYHTVTDAAVRLLFVAYQICNAYRKCCSGMICQYVDANRLNPYHKTLYDNT